jgi:hypothetical protein
VTSDVLGAISFGLLGLICITTVVVMASNTSRDDPQALDFLLTIWPWFATSIPAIALGFWSLCESRSTSWTHASARRALRGVKTGMAGLILGSLMIAGFQQMREATQLMHIG